MELLFNRHDNVCVSNRYSYIIS